MDDLTSELVDVDDDDINPVDLVELSSEPSIPPRNPQRRLLAALALVPLVLFGFCSGLVTVGWLVLDALETPEQAIDELRGSLAKGDLQAAREWVAPAAWPVDEAAAPSGLYELMQDPALSVDDIAWTQATNERVLLDWSIPTAVPEVANERGIELRRGDDGWKVVRFSPGYTDSTLGVLEVVREMSDAATIGDADGFLHHAVAGADTCTTRTCPIVIKAIENGDDHPFIEAIEMRDLVDGSLRVEEGPEEVRLRWLRTTKYLDQAGVVEVSAQPSSGRWKVVAVDARHFEAINEEMDVWTGDHSEMLWRKEINSFVEVGSKRAFCELYNWWGECVASVHPSFVRNLGERTVHRIKISKNRTSRRFRDASQTLWGIYGPIPPGQTRDEPRTVSPPVYGKAGSIESFSFYRVDWVQFDDGERLDFASRDYREEHSIGLTFELARQVRKEAGLTVDELDDLRRKVEDYGYTLDEVERLLAEASESATEGEASPP